MKGRNTQLFARVNEVLGSKTVSDEFMQKSALYKQGFLSADDYYKHCRETMGDITFQDIFAELLVLLPDIAKQQVNKN